MHLGIDYGSKLAGTTAIAYLSDDQICIRQSEKKKDADKFILDLIQELQPKSIFIDAPLSLPNAYFDKGTNFFYRQCDIDLRAMSPMFLGGLTARAMQLKSKVNKQGIDLHECYPKALVHAHEDLLVHYNKKNLNSLEDFATILKEHLPFSAAPCQNWHQIDALLAWLSGHRFKSGKAEIIGDKDEGQIIF